MRYRDHVKRDSDRSGTNSDPEPARDRRQLVVDCVSDRDKRNLDFTLTMALECAGKLPDFSRPRVMGIINVTPDSFSDGGECLSLDRALQRADRITQEGADWIDIGGESTRPGASPVSVQEEVDRVAPVIEAVHARFSLPISVDTSKPEVMRAAVRAGAAMINDVRALREASALETAVEAGVAVCLMHMQGEPRTMQADPKYSDVVSDVCSFLRDRVEACRRAGLNPSCLLLDPGFGFGKTLADNLALLARLRELCALGRPIVVGLSRKSMIGTLTGKPIGERLAGSVAAAVLAAERGARMIRAHDVGATVDALRMAWALLGDRDSLVA